MRADLIERLRAKDAEWQKMCDGWEERIRAAHPDSLPVEAIAIMRQTIEAEAADALQSGLAAEWQSMDTIPTDGKRQLLGVFPRGDLDELTVGEIIYDPSWPTATAFSPWIWPQRDDTWVVEPCLWQFMPDVLVAAFARAMDFSKVDAPVKQLVKL